MVGTFAKVRQLVLGTGPDPAFPFTSHYLTVAGQRMHYLDEGQGEVVLLLHGNPTWCFYYRQLVAALRPHLRVIAPDYIGCGFSDHPTDRHYRAVDRIAQLEELLQQLGVEKFAMVMHDWGGPIGAGLAVRKPDAVQALVFLNTTLSETAALPAIIKTAASPLVGKLLTKHSMRFLKLMTTLGVCRKLPADVCNGYYLPYRTAAQRTAIWDFVADIPFDSRHPSYADMLEMAGKLPLLSEKPVKIVWGLKDPCFHREMLTQVASHFPQAEVLEIADASHLVLEDAPEIAIPAVRDFLLRILTPKLEPVRPHEERRVPQSSANPLAAAFQRLAAEFPRQDAVIEPHFAGDAVHYTHSNYGSLARLAFKYQRGLMELGLAAGDRVLMLVPPGVDFLALSYAVMAAGAVPVFVDPGIGFDKLCACIAAAAPDALIGVPKAHLLRIAKRRLFRQLKFHLAVSDWFLSGGPNLSFLKKFSSSPLPPSDSTGAVLVAFTSGATGTPKGVIFSDEMARAQLAIFGETFGLQPGTKDCSLLPIFSLFGLALGVCNVFAPIDPAEPLSVDPARVARLIQDLNVDSSFGAPTLWNKIAEHCVLNQIQLASLKKVFMAGAPVPRRTLELVQSMLPSGEAFTPYGATEALPVTLVSAREVLAHAGRPAAGGELGVFVGRTLPGIDLRIMRPHAGSVPAWDESQRAAPFEIGEVIVSGANVSKRYLNRPDANKLAKIPAADGRIWHRTGDMGYVDDGGGLYLCGRKMHAVTAENRTYYSLPVERIFNRHPSVKRSALVALAADRPLPGVVIECHQYPASQAARQKLLAELQVLAAADPLTAPITHIFFHRAFPVDARHNAKIYRDELSRWATKEARRAGII